MEELLENPIPNVKYLCVPFVDYEGVIRGDQGKSRLPHDHNRDYDMNAESIYPECNAIKEYAKENGCHYGFDFHSPGHISNENDTVFIVQNNVEKLERFNRFGEILESCITADSLKYEHKNYYPPKTGWNQGGAQFANYFMQMKECHFAFTLETTYFGTPQNKVTESRLKELGHCFARAMKKYIEAQ